MQHKIVIEYKSVDRIEELDERQEQLLRHAYNATKSAYAPYSNFKVGAAVLLENSQVIIGNNQENASYPCGICAERNAIHNTKANFPDSRIISIAVTTHAILPNNQIAMPCGLCRQVLSETEQNNRSDIELILGHPGARINIFNSCSALIPLAFNTENLKIKS